MQNQFNAASLANLSKSELLSLRAGVTAQFHAAASQEEQEHLQSSIQAIDNALARA
ncbi:MAG: hypothetical protein WAT93_13185 [Pontixanthobacter sp.]